MKRLAVVSLVLLHVACGGKSPTQPSALTRIIALSGNLSFGNVAVGSSAQSTMTISNSGTGPLTVASLNGPAVYTANWTSGVIAAGGSQQVTVGFTPATAQSYNSTITVNGDQTAGTNSINVSGAGIAACQQNNTAQVTFQNRSTSNRTYDVSVNNVRLATLTPGNDSQPMTLAAGVTQTIAFTLTNTNTLACAVGTPVYAACDVRTLSCNF